MSLPFPCPSPASTLAIDWSRVEGEAWVGPMAACMQDAEHHAEGDVWTHTKMVCEALVQLPAWQALDADARERVFAGCLLHDIAKPPCTVIEDGRIRHPGHSPRGATMVRELLWRAGAPFHAREEVVALIRHHQVPFFLIDADDPLRRAAEISLRARCRLLALVTEADARGRVCRDQRRLLENIELFVALCDEHGCLDGPYPFPSDVARVAYFRTPGRDPTYAAHDDTRFTVTLMSGLPGAGKDRWIADNLSVPVISLDAIREELGVAPGGGGSEVAKIARERARALLRDAQPFVWNATNLRRDHRARLVDLFMSYGARVRIVYVEAPCARLFQQNRARAAVVPVAVIERMLRGWDVPDASEAHEVVHVVSE
ncbi:MAG: AAA family ATPase [Nannocystaceae bacterium]|nr:AAA family ATPase [Myxococcales bacterium]